MSIRSSLSDNLTALLRFERGMTTSCTANRRFLFSSVHFSIPAFLLHDDVLIVSD